MVLVIFCQYSLESGVFVGCTFISGHGTTLIRKYSPGSSVACLLVKIKNIFLLVSGGPPEGVGTGGVGVVTGGLVVPSIEIKI